MVPDTNTVRRTIADSVGKFWDQHKDNLRTVIAATEQDYEIAAVFPVAEGVVVRYSPSEEKVVTAQFVDAKTLAEFRDKIQHVPGVNGEGSVASKIVFEYASPEEFLVESPSVYMDPRMDPVMALGYIIDALTQKDHQTAPGYLTENVKHHFSRCENFAQQVTEYTGIEHTMHFTPGKGVRAFYELPEHITAIVAPGGRYHDIDIEFPTGEMANECSELLIEMGTVPDVRAMGHAGQQDGLRMLRDDLTHFANSVEPTSIGYHADDDGTLLCALKQFFVKINEFYKSANREHAIAVE